MDKSPAYARLSAVAPAGDLPTAPTPRPGTRPLKAVFRMDEGQASRVMMTAHQRGACVVAVFTREVAEEKATLATDMARKRDYLLLFTTEPEE